MPKLYSSREVLAALRRGGFVETGQRGSHVKLRNGQGRTVIVKHPASTIPAGTFASILRQAGLTRAEFEALLA
jgi:predicted RNA binding protein YcfA (HicA-like mRNA interferase family)